MIVFAVNPLLLKTAFPLLCTLLVFAVGVLLIRSLRKQVAQPEITPPVRVLDENTQSSTLAAYEGVIRKMKEQERELERLRNIERSRATASELLSAAVPSNLSSGVVVFNKNVTIRSANESARAILGYASPAGLHARDLFRGVREVRLQSGESSPGPDALLTGLDCSLADGIAVRRIEADYQTPQNRQRVLGFLRPARRAGQVEQVDGSCLREL